MKSYKYLNLKGVTLDKEQLQNYMEKIAVNYEIDMKSDVETYPINRLMDNYNFIQITYNTLNEHIKNELEENGIEFNNIIIAKQRERTDLIKL